MVYSLLNVFQICNFLPSFFFIVVKKDLKRLILTSQWCLKNGFAGQNIQHKRHWTLVKIFIMINLLASAENSGRRWEVAKVLFMS